MQSAISPRNVHFFQPLRENKTEAQVSSMDAAAVQKLSVR